MDEKIIYRPNHTQTFFAYAMLVLGLIALLISGMFLSSSKSVEMLIFLTVSCIELLLAHFHFALSKVMIVFETSGLSIINDRSIRYRYVSWKDFGYGCYERNYKGHKFLVMSKCKLSKEQAKKLANKGANFSKVCVEDAIVIYLDSLQDTSKIKGIVEKNIASMLDELSKKPENMT